jgi:hypothetical protein
MTYVSPKWLVTEILRARLTDPQARSEATTTSTHTATSSQTDFTITPSGSNKVSCITSVTDNASAVTKNEDYWVDLRNNKVIFFTGRTTGHAIVITYKYGTSNWIYPDVPLVSIGTAKTSWPRISITTIDDTIDTLGNYSAPQENVFRFQVDVWAKEGVVYTISSNAYEGENLCEYLSWKIVEVFRDYMTDFYPAFYDFVVLSGPRDLPFDEDRQAFRKTMDIQLKQINSGEVDWK